MTEIGVEHTFELNAYSIVPFGLLGEVEQPGLWVALHLGVSHPLGIGGVGIGSAVLNEIAIDVEIVIDHVAGLTGDGDRFLLHTVETAIAYGDVLHIDGGVESDDEDAVVALVAGHVFHRHVAH